MLDIHQLVFSCMGSQLFSGPAATAYIGYRAGCTANPRQSGTEIHGQVRPDSSCGPLDLISLHKAAMAPQAFYVSFPGLEDGHFAGKYLLQTETYNGTNVWKLDQDTWLYHSGAQWIFAGSARDKSQGKGKFISAGGSQGLRPHEVVPPMKVRRWKHCDGSGDAAVHFATAAWPQCFFVSFRYAHKFSRFAGMYELTEEYCHGMPAWKRQPDMWLYSTRDHWRLASSRAQVDNHNGEIVGYGGSSPEDDGVQWTPKGLLVRRSSPGQQPGNVLLEVKTEASCICEGPYVLQPTRHNGMPVWRSLRHTDLELCYSNEGHWTIAKQFQSVTPQGGKMPEECKEWQYRSSVEGSSRGLKFVWFQSGNRTFCLRSAGHWSQLHSTMHSTEVDSQSRRS